LHFEQIHLTTVEPGSWILLCNVDSLQVGLGQCFIMAGDPLVLGERSTIHPDLKLTHYRPMRSVQHRCLHEIAGLLDSN